MTFATTISSLMDLAFVRGVVVGFALAAPMGPVAALCICRALARGFIESFVAGLGAALADMAFGAVAGLGITVISAFVLSYETGIELLGGAVVLSMGVTTYRAPVVITDGAIAVGDLRRDFAAAFTMAVTNPATLIAAVGLFAAFGPIDIYTAPGAAFWLVAGVFTGSAAWWLILAGAVATLRQRVLTNGLPWLNRVSGGIIALSGAVVLALAVLRILGAGI